MAVYTDLSDEDVEALLADFDLGAALSLKGIAEGVENTNFLLHTERGRFILTIYEKRVNPDDLPFFMQLMETLADKGIPSPRPMHGKDGKPLRRIKNKLSALVTFLDGVSPKKPSANQCRALGAAMGQMHVALADFPLQRANSLGAASWPKLFEGRHAAAENLKAGEGDRVAADLQFLSANWPASLPHGVIHADLFPDNALFLGDRRHHRLLLRLYGCTRLRPRNKPECVVFRTLWRVQSHQGPSDDRRLRISTTTQR